MRTLRPAITDEMATLVGHVTASWNLVEMQLQAIMQALLRTDASRCQIVFLSHQTCRAKIELTKNLGIACLPEQERKKFDKLMKKTSELSLERNFLVHAIYAAGRSKTSNALLRRNKPEDDFYTSKLEMTIVTTKELKEKLTAIQRLGSDLQQLAFNLATEGRC
jgi:hypothetical protein